MANTITCIRFLCALTLAFFPTFSTQFYVFYTVGGISDVLDGIVARTLGKETKLGARLDTAADVVFTVIVLIKVLRAVIVPTWLTVWIIGIAVIKCFNVVMGFVLYQRFVPEHTVMNKICGILLFAVPFSVGLFPHQAVAVLILLTCGLSTLAAVQEGYYIRTGKFIC